LRERRYSRRTEEAYLHWIVSYIRYNGRTHPAELGAEHVTAYLSHLAVSEQVAAATQNQASAALKFLYHKVLALPLGPVEGFVTAHRPRRLPAVLWQGEVREICRHLTPALRLVVTLLYGSGLRLLERLRLRIKDIDIDRLEILVRDGKGARRAFGPAGPEEPDEFPAHRYVAGIAPLAHRPVNHIAGSAGLVAFRGNCTCRLSARAVRTVAHVPNSTTVRSVRGGTPH
jgi:site-specific recombinase XerD